MDRQKIIIFLDSSQLGGIETHIVHLALALKQADICSEILFFKRYSERHPLEDKLITHGIEYSYLSGSFLQLKDKLTREKPLLLHTHGYKAGVLGRLAALPSKTPVVSTFHNGDQGSGMVRLYTLLDKFTSRLSTNIAVSEEIALRFPNRPAVINNFINLSSITSPLGKHVAFVGRLSHEKGPDIFLQIAERLPDIAFKMIGGGPMEKEIFEQSASNILCLGQVKDMEAQWDDIGLLCISSREEGLPMVALEAMSRGIPVAAYRLGALPELIKQNCNGWIAPTGNIRVMAELVSNWSKLDAAQLSALSKSCQQTIEQQYSYDAILPEILTVYKQALSKKGLPWPENQWLSSQKLTATELRE
ncbi:glycosyltransferase family 4 protein [Endozoicomonas arenosclerae]|uniref:glycosyltransferase family 4 protein n=1 Tax=Endozoicomonas arenosclerae TaxID=1633495 RepID=UPI000783B94E|nr:glycosyltransferase family 4 protein [Endozoicomonas arenosclerae]